METLRVAAARRRLKKSEISRKTGLDPRTIERVMDDIPDNAYVGTLRQIAEKLDLELVLEFREKGE